MTPPTCSGANKIRISEQNRRQDHQPNVKLRWMEEALHYLDVIKIHAPGFDCAIDGSSAASDQEVCTGPATSCSTDHKNSEYRLPSVPSGRPTSEHIPSILVWHSAAQLQTKTKVQSMANDTTEHTGLY